MVTLPSCFQYLLGQTYSTVWQIVLALGAKVRPRKGFGFIPKTSNKYAIWCIQPNGKYWTNTISRNGDEIIEKKVNENVKAKFQRRVFNNKENIFDVNLNRITFVKDKGKYRFLGIFQIKGIDFDNLTVSYKKVSNAISISLVKQRIVEIKVTEITTEIIQTI